MSDWMFIVASILGAAFVLAGGYALFTRPGRRLVQRLKPRRPSHIFVRWLEKQHIDALSAADVTCVPHKVRDVDGILIQAPHTKRALQTLHARALASFPTDHEGVDEAVLAFANSEEKPINIYGNFQIRKFRWVKNWLATRRLKAALRDTFVPLVQKPVSLHLCAGRTAKAENDGAFHIYVWSSTGGSWRQKPPERLFGVPVANRDQGFGLSGRGIPIFESPSEYAVAELVDTDHLYIHFNALATAGSTELALLARIADAVREEMDVDKFLAEIVSKLPDDGMPIGAAHAANFSVYDQGFEGRRRDVVKQLVHEILIPAVRMDVLVQQCGGINQNPLEDGMFHVFVASSPIGRQGVATPERLWGYRLLKQETAFLPSGQGAPIADESGFQIAELVGSNLYVFADLIHYGNSKGAALFAKLLMEVRRELVALNGSDRAGLEEKRFVDEVWRHIAASGKPDANAMKVATRDVTTALKATRMAEQECFRLESTPAEAIGKEFDELCKINKVLDITVSDTTLTVTTDVLYCRDPRDGVLHEIGAFRIQIPTSRGTAIVWKNLTRTASGPDGKRMNAPHIDPSGHACLGNTKDLFPDLIGRREFSSAVELAIAFVESVNVSDVWGKYIVNWPVAVR